MVRTSRQDVKARSGLESKISFVFAVEQLLPLKDRFGFAAGAGVRFTVLGKRGLGKDSERVMERFLNDCTFDLSVSEAVATIRALEHPAWHWRREPFRLDGVSLTAT